MSEMSRDTDDDVIDDVKDVIFQSTKSNSNFNLILRLASPHKCAPLNLAF